MDAAYTLYNTHKITGEQYKDLLDGILAKEITNGKLSVDTENDVVNKRADLADKLTAEKVSAAEKELAVAKTANDQIVAEIDRRNKAVQFVDFTQMYKGLTIAGLQTVMPTDQQLLELQKKSTDALLAMKRNSDRQTTFLQMLAGDKTALATDLFN